MSLSKRLCLRSQSQKRQSFSERICDDLSEVILQYLPLKDKLRLECVSKQFQRTVFQRHYRLGFRTYREDNSIEELLLQKYRFDLKALEVLLKKCPFIRSILLFVDPFEDINGFKCRNYNEFIDIIMKYCNNLREFKSPLTPINKNTFQLFHRKFGSKLKVCKHIENEREVNRFKCFPNLEELVVGVEFQTVIDKYLLYLIKQENFPKLKTLRVFNFGSEDKKLFSSIIFRDLINKFKTIRYLELSTDDDYEWDEVVWESVSNLKELIHLKLMVFPLKPNPNPNLFSGSFRQLANNCPKLKSISLRLTINWKNFLEFRRLLSPLKAFKQLTRFKLQLSFSESLIDYQSEDSDDSIYSEESEDFSFDVFKGLSNMTYLSLEPIDFFNDDSDEKFLTNLDIYLPNLKTLKFYGFKSFGATPEGTTQMADTLSRLSKLRSIKMILCEDSMGRQLRDELIDKCKRIRTIEFKRRDVKSCQCFPIN